MVKRRTRKPFLFLLVLLFLSANRIVPAPPLSVVYYSCTGANYTAHSAFATNLAMLFDRLVNASSVARYVNASSTSAAGDGNGNGDAYGIFQCRGDLNQADCASCVPVVVQVAKDRCPYSPGAQVMLDSCFLHYNTTSSFYTTSPPNFNRTIGLYNTENNTDPAFTLSIVQALIKISTLAPRNGGFAVDQEGLNVFALGQCFGYLSPDECGTCLSQILDTLKYTLFSIGAQFVYGSCYYRYETGIFYSLPSPLPSPLSEIPSPSPTPSFKDSTKSSNSTGLVVAGVVLAFFLVFLAGATLCICKRRKAKQTCPPGSNKDENINSLQRSVVQFSYIELMAATRNFTAENKIGEGGFGPVYKGVLEDGRQVAIKKLSSISHQGKREFMNEVSTITSVQHRNLIRLLGCCVEGLEKLLVYEYLPNKSLNKHLFIDHPMDLVLDWDTRFRIILGIARGLAYLHHDSQIRIVHRDIKPSNILLADDFTPKIADFGLAKLIADDNNRASTTRVVGTFGYMAPEYAMHGQLTDKVDVFGFGLVALEVVSGRRNTDFHQPPNKQHLLEWAWKMFNEGRQLELVDERMRGNFSEEEAIRVVHGALLCTQSFSVLRPTMPDVIQFLVGQLEILGTPTIPAFINTSLAMPTGYSTSEMTRFNSASYSMSQIEGR